MPRRFIRGSMQYPVTRFLDLTTALRELAPYIRHGRHLEIGKPFRTLGDMRSREALANWLICATSNNNGPQRYQFTSDPVGGDGVILDTHTEDTWSTEHILIPSRNRANKTAHDLILEAVKKKNSRGAAYARGKILVVMINAVAGPYFPNRLTRALPGNLSFDDVWVVGLQRVYNGRYIYGVTWLNRRAINAPTFVLTIEPGFDAWHVRRIQ